MDKFHPDDLKNPVYEYSQVVTVHDLAIIYSNLARQYSAAKWWQYLTRLNLSVAGHVIRELASWLDNGKPSLRK